MHQSLARLPIPGADVSYLEQLPIDLDPAVVLQRLLEEIDWRQENVVVQGRTFPQPRLTAWHGDPGMAYTYSGLSLEPQPWTPLLQRLKDAVEALTGAQFNSALLNAYRNERSSIGFHSDNEKELGREPVIASLSFGEERTFTLKPRFNKSWTEHHLPLRSGSLLVMAGATQRNWLHGVPKERRPMGPRVNITFRRIYPELG